MDKNKKFSNDLQLIHIPTKERNQIVTLYEPLSPYFKMVEIIFDFKYLKSVMITILNQPRGSRFGQHIICHIILIDSRIINIGITLFSNNKDIPRNKVVLLLILMKI